MNQYIGPSPQEIEEMVAHHLDHLLSREGEARIQALHLLVLNRIEQSLDRLAENLSENPELDQIATTLDKIRRGGLPIENMYGGKS